MASAIMTYAQILLGFVDHFDSIQQHLFIEPRESY